MNRILKAKIIENFGTQADFAQAIGTDETIVSRVIRERRTLNENNQSIWAKALKCEPEEVFSMTVS